MTAALRLALDLARTVRPKHVAAACHERWLNADRHFFLAGYAHYLQDAVEILEPEDTDWFWRPRAVSYHEWPYTEPFV